MDHDFEIRLVALEALQKDGYTVETDVSRLIEEATISQVLASLATLEASDLHLYYSWVTLVVSCSFRLNQRMLFHVSS